MKDWRGYICKIVRRYRLRFYNFISSVYVYFDCAIRGISLGKNNVFWGRPVIIRSHKSSVTIGSNCGFRSDFTSNLVGLNRKCIITTLRSGSEVIIGNNSGFSGTVIAAAGSIKIGNNVLCGANTTITDYDWHGIEPDKRRTAPGPKRVVIEDNVWLGLNSVVLKGVTIGKNSVIGANSLVTKDIPENVIAAGNPCKVIKKLTI